MESTQETGLLVSKAHAQWEEMEAGGCEQLVPGPAIKPKTRVQLRL